jgi:hypothetical protein
VGAGSTTGYGTSPSSSNSSGSQHVRISEARTDSQRGRSRSGALGVLEGLQQMDLEGTGTAAANTASKDAAAAEEQPAGLTRTRRKSLRILSVAEVDAAVPAAGSSSSAPSSTAEATSPTLRSKSLLGCMKQNSIASCSKVGDCMMYAQQSCQQSACVALASNKWP